MDTESLYYILAVVSAILITLTTTLYVCCHWMRVKSPKRTKLYGRIQDTTIRSGLKKKIRNDPFRVTGLDMLRRFEDALANYLYSVCSEVALNRIDNYRIVFLGGAEEHYQLNYVWLLNHIYHNAREYAYLFTETKDKKTKEAVFKLRSTPLTVTELQESLSSHHSPPYRIEEIQSISHHLRYNCGELKTELNDGSNCVTITEGFDSINKDTRDRTRNVVMATMIKGIEIVNIIQLITPNSSKVIKDHYNTVMKLSSIMVEEYIPYCDLVIDNRRKYDETDLETNKETIMAALEDITVNAYNDDVWEILATSILPRFRKSLL